MPGSQTHAFTASRTTAAGLSAAWPGEPLCQSAPDRFTSNSFDLVIEGESYRARQKPRLPRRT